MLRIQFSEMVQAFVRVLLKMGFTQQRAETCAKLFAEASRDGVYTHGLNRFPRFIDYIKKGYIDVSAEPEKVAGFGAWERWDGKLGPGNLNAAFCMERAITLAGENGLGCVAIKNTNHWMRGGSYGWQAVEAGCIGICWTNTGANMPAWGAKNCTLGNNPFIMAVPGLEGHVVLDMAMSQFSYGKMETSNTNQEMLPVDGGFDREGNLTRNPGAILEAGRPLPIGYWKGSGFSILLDLVVTILSGGNSLAQTKNFEAEYGVSQVFIAFDLSKLPDQGAIHQAVIEIIANVHQAIPDHEGGKIYYPGERTLLTRGENLKNGIPVDEEIWQKVLAM